MEEDTLISQEDEVYEPNVNSSNPNERKEARRLRIQRRIEALTKIQQGVNDETASKTEVRPPIEAQLEKSLALLDKLQIEANEHVTNVKVANEAREADRRERDGFNKEKLLQELEDEASSAADAFGEITSKWSGILQYNDPLHISEDIQAQKEKCNELVQQKDALIASLKAQLRTCEINFARDQRKQDQDIDSIARRIEKQTSAMRAAYRHEMALVEAVIEAERQAMLEANAKKWEELAKKRDQEENYNSEKKREDYWNFVKEMDDLNRSFEELFRLTNINLENDCDELQKELERIKTEVLMNGEKLDYNYQILKKREDENMIIRSQQKRRINKLQDQINNLRKTSAEYHTKTTDQIVKLGEEVKKLSRSTLDLDNKCDHVSKCNDQKFHKIWDMNVERVTGLLNKILDVDRILHEQQLGIEWHPPEQTYVKREDLPTYKAALKKMIEFKMAEESRKLERNPSGFKEPKTENYNNIVRNILKLIEEKTGFLIKDDLHAVLEPYCEADRELIKVDNIFTALNISNRDDIDLLLNHFIPYSFCPMCAEHTEAEENKKKEDDTLSGGQIDLDGFFSDTSSSVGHSRRTSFVERTSVAGVEVTVLPALQATHGGTIDLGSMSVAVFQDVLQGECKGPTLPEENKGDKREDDESSRRSSKRSNIPCQYQHPLMINPIYVLRALNEFLSAYHEVKKSKQKIDLSENKMTISRMVADADIVDYWQKYRQSFPEERVQLWDGLMEGLRKYHEVLKTRKLVCEEVQSLRRQNTELHRMFGNYIDKYDFPYKEE